MSLLDQLFDPENTDIITLYDPDGKRLDFEQVAVVPQGEEVYVILSLVTPMEGVEENTGFVFRVEDIEDEPSLTLITEDAIVDAVFDVYERLSGEE